MARRTPAGVTRKPGRPKGEKNKQRADETGGRNAQSRGFGMVLRSARLAVCPDELSMLTALLAVPPAVSPFPIARQYKITGTNAAKNRHNAEEVLRRWESGESEPRFGLQHRYGVLTGIWPGVLQMIGLFYSDLRDASNGETWKRTRVRDITTRLKALIIHIEAVLDESPPRPIAGNPLNDLTGPVASDHMTFITEMLDAYGINLNRPGDPGWSETASGSHKRNAYGYAKNPTTQTGRRRT